MGISALHSRNSVGTPKTPIDTPKRKPMNIRESNWRQGQSNVQGASDIPRRDAVELSYLQDRNPHLISQRTYLSTHASSVI